MLCFQGDVGIRKEEERKWGVFFEDEYDYLQHLKNVQESSVSWAPAVVSLLKYHYY